MPTDLAISAVLGVSCTVLGLILGGLCLWWRSGSSPAARWWVRTTPVEHMRSMPPFEAPALVLLPVAVQTLLALAVLLGLAPHISREVTGLLWPLVGVIAVQCALFLVAHWLTFGRRVMPLWVYPAWLREQRRADAEWLCRHGNRRRC